MQSLWILLSSLLFAFMGICVKLASSLYTTSEIILYRGIFSIIFLFFLARINHVSLKTSMPRRHFIRGMISAVALWLWFYSIGQLPLAMANTLAYMSPIWITAMLFGLNWWQGKTHFSWKLPGAIALSFIGVVLLLQPSMQPEQLPVALISLISGMLSAMAYLQVRAMGLAGEPETRVVFYFSLTSTITGALTGAIDGDWHAHQPVGIALLLLIGFFGCIAQLTMTRAYRLGNPLLTANLSYSGIIFSSLAGLLIWQDELNFLSWTGITVIIISGMLATYLYTSRPSMTLAKK